jgi:hypothetical protein
MHAFLASPSECMVFWRALPFGEFGAWAASARTVPHSGTST